MKQLDKIKEFTDKLSGKTKKMIVSAVMAVAAFSIIAAVVLNHKEYTVLFSGLNEEESAEVISKLQDEGVTYQYDQAGKIMVPTETADRVRATMAMEGYPKSGFNYDIFINNAGLMSTESDKQTYKLYELQNRIGASIRTFDGVKSAIVTINPAETKKYVLDNDKESKASAYVVVTMGGGGSLTKDQAEAIQRLVSTSVPDMSMGDVAVIDSNGRDVSAVRNEGENGGGSTDKKTEYEKFVEGEVEAKILNVLEAVYGRNNVKASVKCTADMQKVISEEINYTAPNTQENSGYISRQAIGSEIVGNGAGAAGVPGAQTNTNVPQYNTQAQANADGTRQFSSDTEYELNQRKVQGQNDGGAITDMTVAVTINTRPDNAGAEEDAQPITINKNEIVDLVAKAAGIAPEVQAQKIAVLTAEFYDNSVPVVVPPDTTKDFWTQLRPYLPILIACGVGFLILLIVLIILISKSKKKKKRKKLEADAAAAAAAAAAARSAYLERQAVQEEQPEEESPYDELKTPQAKKLRNDVMGFTEENPEISASLLKTWLRGGDDE